MVFELFRVILKAFMQYLILPNHQEKQYKTEQPVFLVFYIIVNILAPPSPPIILNGFGRFSKLTLGALIIRIS